MSIFHMGWRKKKLWSKPLRNCMESLSLAAFTQSHLKQKTHHVDLHNVLATSRFWRFFWKPRLKNNSDFEINSEISSDTAWWSTKKTMKINSAESYPNSRALGQGNFHIPWFLRPSPATAFKCILRIQQPLHSGSTSWEEKWCLSEHIWHVSNTPKKRLGYFWVMVCLCIYVMFILWTDVMLMFIMGDDVCYCVRFVASNSPPPHTTRYVQCIVKWVTSMGG